MAYFPPKFGDCTICRFYRPETGSVKCLPCEVGENFEEKINDRQPDDDELMKMFANMRGTFEDE
jgi:hypothetical protein